MRIVDSEHIAADRLRDTSRWSRWFVRRDEPVTISEWAEFAVCLGGGVLLGMAATVAYLALFPSAGGGCLLPSVGGERPGVVASSRPGSSQRPGGDRPAAVGTWQPVVSR